jgi:hypothetical protein
MDERTGERRAGPFVVEAIGVVTSTRADVVDDDWDAVTSSIVLRPPFDARSVAGLDTFSHGRRALLIRRAGCRAAKPSRPAE